MLRLPIYPPASRTLLMRLFGSFVYPDFIVFHHSLLSKCGKNVHCLNLKYGSTPDVCCGINVKVKLRYFC